MLTYVVCLAATAATECPLPFQRQTAAVCPRNPNNKDSAPPGPTPQTEPVPSSPSAATAEPAVQQIAPEKQRRKRGFNEVGPNKRSARPAAWKSPAMPTDSDGCGGGSRNSTAKVGTGTPHATRTDSCTSGARPITRSRGVPGSHRKPPEALAPASHSSASRGGHSDSQQGRLSHQPVPGSKWDVPFDGDVKSAAAAKIMVESGTLTVPMIHHLQKRIVLTRKHPEGSPQRLLDGTDRELDSIIPLLELHLDLLQKGRVALKLLTQSDDRDRTVDGKQSPQPPPGQKKQPKKQELKTVPLLTNATPQTTGGSRRLSLSAPRLPNLRLNRSWKRPGIRYSIPH